MHEAFILVRRDQALLERVVDCWASLYGQRVIAYEVRQGMHAEPAITVVVRRLVPAERAGVMFTATPSSGQRSQVVIEAAFGLGEVVVSGQVEPDTYAVAKETRRCPRVRVGHRHKKVELVPKQDGSVAAGPRDHRRMGPRALSAGCRGATWWSHDRHTDRLGEVSDHHSAFYLGLKLHAEEELSDDDVREKVGLDRLVAVVNETVDAIEDEAVGDDARAMARSLVRAVVATMRDVGRRVRSSG